MIRLRDPLERPGRAPEFRCTVHGLCFDNRYRLLEAVQPGDRLVLRRVDYHPESTIVATIGMLYIIQQAVLTLYGPDARPVDPPVYFKIDFPWFGYSGYKLVVAGISALLLAGTWWLLTRTTLGLYMRAAQQDLDVLTHAVGAVRAVQDRALLADEQRAAGLPSRRTLLAQRPGPVHPAGVGIPAIGPGPAFQLLVVEQAVRPLPQEEVLVFREAQELRGQVVRDRVVPGEQRHERQAEEPALGLAGGAKDVLLARPPQLRSRTEDGDARAPGAPAPPAVYELAGLNEMITRKLAELSDACSG